MKYANGYQEKIAYWTEQLTKAVKEGNARGIAKANDKINYFVGRQEELLNKKKESNNYEVPKKNMNYDEAVQSTVNLLGDSRGTVQQKETFFNHKMEELGFSKKEATQIWLQAVNIASEGELLRSI